MSKLLNTNGTLNIDVIKDAVDTFYYSTKIPVFAIDEFGNKIYTQNQKHSFCCLFPTITNQKSMCKDFHLAFSKEAVQYGEGYIYQCPVTFTHFSSPIVYEYQFKGAIVAGPILLQSVDDYTLDIVTSKYPIDENYIEVFREYLNSIPVIEPHRVTYLNKLLFNLTSNLLGKERFALMEKNIKYHQQSEISENIHDYKDQKIEDYPYDKERELYVKVKFGDELGARRLLNDLLGHIFFSSGANIDVIRTRILELFSILSRAAVEGGASINKIFDINNTSMNKLYDIDNIEDLTYWTQKILDRFTESVFNLSSFKNSDIIRSALNYINEHYMENITLNDIANHLHLNYSYFSSLFKTHVGVKFSDYLNKVRIDEAKKHLRESDLPILDIALIVGYESQSYFTKMFKKLTGVTPTYFRNN